MADVMYNTAAFPALTCTLRGLLHGSKDPPMVLLGFKERDPDERTLWPMLADVAGLVLTQVARQPGAGGAPVEIWIGSIAEEAGNL